MNNKIIITSNIKPNVQLTSCAAKSLISFVFIHKLLKNCKSETEVELNNINVKNTQPITNETNNNHQKIAIIFQKDIFFFFFAISFFSISTTFKNNFSHRLEGTVFEIIL